MAANSPESGYAVYKWDRNYLMLHDITSSVSLLVARTQHSGSSGLMEQYDKAHTQYRLEVTRDLHFFGLVLLPGAL